LTGHTPHSSAGPIIIETPALIKKRFIKNIELKGLLNFEAKNNDYILELAKKIVKNENIDPINIENIKDLKKLYKENDNDLTIITNYLVEKIDNLITSNKNNKIGRVIPWISKYEAKFIKMFNNNDHSYSLKDFININNTSYETARKSMDKLVLKELYTKEKIGKKFIYKPTDKLIKIIKGGV